MSASRTIPVIEVPMDKVKRIIERAELSAEDRQLMLNLAESYIHLTEMVKDKSTRIEQLRKLLFGSQSEKLDDVFGAEPGDEAPEADGGGAEEAAAGPEEGPKKKAKGHGRNGADDYPGAERIKVPHESLRSGDCCPDCKKGKVYKQPPALTVLARGTGPIQASVVEQERLRCNLCGTVFTARMPAEIDGSRKYDATAASMIALLKYGSGLPFNRLAGLQGNLGVPLPPSTQWDIVSDLAEKLDPVYEELIGQAAQGEVVHNDDTTMKILERMGKRREKNAMFSEGDSERTGVFTSGIVSTAEGLRIALFFTGNRHAGENLEQILARRGSEHAPPIQMCDALSRNTSEDFKTIVANCLAHGRRKFVDAAGSFPQESKHVLEILGEVYQHDATAKKRGLSAEERLAHHQAHSRDLMDELKRWMDEQIEQRKVEPNSGLGQAIGYMQKHWKKLTRFLEVAGAPLDNNICERSLKKAILHRKNSLFYKTDNGARVGDLFMSLIHTCQLMEVNAFDYLTELQRRIDDVHRAPRQWMPWSYRQTLTGDTDGGTAEEAASTGSR